jgi:hypothetical protein
MENFKENAFTYSLVGLGIVFVVLFYLLIWGPLGTFADKGSELDRARRTLKGYSREDPIPCRELVEFRRAEGEQNQASFEEALKVYAEKTRKFGLFFDDQVNPPAAAEFYGRYRDGIRGMQGPYREAHGLPTAPQDPRQDLGDLPPVVQLVEDKVILQDPATQIPVAMKQYWIVKDVFDACKALDLGGLKEISFPTLTARERSRRARKNEEESVVDFEYVTAEVKISMTFEKIEDFLEHLYGSERVPFVQPDISVTKDEEAQRSHLKIARVESFTGEGQGEKEARAAVYEAKVPEPPVDVTFLLRALDYRGLRPEQPETEEAE